MATFHERPVGIEVTSRTVYTLRVRTSTGKLVTVSQTTKKPSAELLQSISDMQNIQFHTVAGRFTVTTQKLPEELRSELKRLRRVT